MPLTPDSELREAIAHNWEEYSDTPYDTDFIVGFAETQLPIYYNEIIEHWQQLPDNYKDSWSDGDFTPNSTIYNLMSIDLYNYYSDRTSEILDQIRQETDNA